MVACHDSFPCRNQPAGRPRGKVLEHPTRIDRLDPAGEGTEGDHERAKPNLEHRLRRSAYVSDDRHGLVQEGVGEVDHQFASPR